MSAIEPLIRHGDDAGELRVRYNELCVALTALAGRNNKAADRVLQELQTLAQQIAFRQAEATSADRAAAGAGLSQATTVTATPGRTGNVIAFRCKVKGVSQEHPRPAAVLGPIPDRGPRPVEEAPADVATTPRGVATHDASRSQLADTVVKQGSDLDRLARQSDEQASAIERFERQLGTSGPLSTLSVQVAALRAATQRQGQQMVSLATSVHRLAKLLAAQVPPHEHR